MEKNQSKIRRTSRKIVRVQTGVRIEKRILKVLKGLAAYNDISLGDLIEGIVLHAFDGKLPFNEHTIAKIRDIKKIYSVNLSSQDSHQLIENAK